MYVLMEAMRSAIAAIWVHRLRSFLTSLGIIIGVASVVAVISLIQGLSQSISRQFEGLGGNALTVSAKNEYKDILRGKFNYLRQGDVDQLRFHVDGVRIISPLFNFGSGEVRYGATTATARTMASTPSYQEVQQRYTQLGRFLTESDERTARRVCVIGQKLIESLHLPENPIGQFVQFSGDWFKIVGVLEKRGDIFGISQDDAVIIPFKTGQSLMGNNIRPPNMIITVALEDIARVDEVKVRIANVMRVSHRLKSGTPDDFELQSSDQIAKSFENLSATVTIVMGGVVGIALLVGGIGIMNMMLVSVTERTREIGICKAIGARSRDIMLQFLFEAITISFFGGIVGLVLGYLLGAGIAQLIPGFPGAFVPLWAVVMSFLFSSMVGVVFGVVPAAQAAKLDPIEALRYE